MASKRSGRCVLAGVLVVVLAAAVLPLAVCAQDTEAAPTAEKLAQKILETARTYEGTPYVFGGNSREGTDTSGFVKAVFMEAGLWGQDAPRTAMSQMDSGLEIRGNQLQPGDRLYFDFVRDSESGRRAPGVADHTGIFIGGGEFIHATPPKCRTNKLTGTYVDHLIAARRDAALQPPGPPIPADAGPKVQKLLKIAYTYIGTPYVFGGNSRRGLDTSAFTQVVFAHVGINLPRTALTQQKVGTAVPRDQVQPGDRLLFDFVKEGKRSDRRGTGVADHTGIYIGGGKFIHATPPRLRVNALSGRYMSNLLDVRRDALD